jgi:NTE family protein
MSKKRVSLVLSSGGARGMAHIGVIEELEKEGFEIAAIAGSSIGALVGAFYAAGKLEQYKEWVSTLDKFQVWRLFDFTFSMQGFVRGEKVFRELEKFIGDCQLEDLPIPLYIVAADIHNQKERIITDGSMFKAIRASVAIPTILTPLIYKDGQFVDGGVVNPLPLEYIPKNEEKLVVAVNLNANIPYSRPKQTEKEKSQRLMYLEQMEAIIQRWRKFFPADKAKETSEIIKKQGLFDIMNTSLDLMQDKISTLILQTHKPDIVVSISKDACDAFEFYRAADMIELGKKSFAESYLEYKKQQEGDEVKVSE